MTDPKQNVAVGVPRSMYDPALIDPSFMKPCFLCGQDVYFSARNKDYYAGQETIYACLPCAIQKHPDDETLAVYDGAPMSVADGLRRVGIEMSAKLGRN